MQVRRQHLMTVNVSGQDGRESPRNGPSGNDVGTAAKDEIGRTDGCSFDRLVQTEKADGRRYRSPSGPLHGLGEAVADAIALARKARHRDLDPAHVEGQGAGVVEDVDAGMGGEEGKGDGRALVISGNDDDRDAGVGDALERLERAQDHSRFDAAAEEDVAAMNEEIDVARERGPQRPLVTGEEVLPPAEVRVGINSTRIIRQAYGAAAAFDAPSR